ncbi:hypothetical protein [Pseudoalteromonas marina]|uniref:Uncharacterized protein n=1 Tax=Pseudoalteromonas marina TaxID=267375 RepID=A0ABT9FI08_9GAMM|nr:hypothetical protein [Pseudoalteromonas marina]MDP2566394.1 hypothetical protein [Pseudoalteromonas marina]
MQNTLLPINALTNEFTTRTKPQTPIVFIIDCMESLDTSNINDIIRPTKPTFIVLPNQETDDNKQISKNITLITDKRDLSSVLKIFVGMKVEISAIVCDYKFNSELLLKNSTTLKLAKTKLAIVHGHNGNETQKLAELFDFGAKHVCTINNTFEQHMRQDTDRGLVSIFDIRTLRNKPLKNEHTQTLQNMSYCAYFDSRFNSFGLHSSHEGRKLIVIDYEYLYDVTKFEIVKIENQKLIVEEKFDTDPFPLLSRQLRSRSFHTKEKALSVSIEDRLYAAHIRKHMKSTFAKRELMVTECTKEILQQLNKPITASNINNFSKLITCTMPTTFISQYDRDSFKLLHHSPRKFLKKAKKDMNMFFAKDIYNSRLYFELAKKEIYSEILQYFLKNAHPMIFNTKSTDSNCMTMLEIAAAYNQPVAITHLINYGAEINYVSEFNSTALDRAISNNAEVARIALELKNAKIASELKQNEM